MAMTTSAPATNRKQRRAAAARAATETARFPEAWRTAIVDQLMDGHPAPNIVQGLVNAGADRASAEREVKTAQQHPYLRSIARKAARLRKYEWQLDMYAQHWRMGAGETLEIPRVRNLSTEDFLRDYYAAHRPVIIEDAAQDWPAMSKWSLDYFEERAGDAEIEVQFGRTRSDDYEHQREKFARVMRFRDILARLRTGEVTNDYYLTANNTGRNRKALAVLWEDVSLISAYLTGKSYADGFFWLGPKGTITPYHHDLTNNLLVQVMGRKRVRLVPSYQGPLMRNFKHCYSEWSSGDLPVGLSQDAAKPDVIECVIGPGEGLFIPIGWWHWVEGLDVTASMSFTNFKWENAFYNTYKSYGDL